MKRINFLSMLLFLTAPAFGLPAAKAKSLAKVAQPASCLTNPAVPYAAQLKAGIASLPKPQQQEIESLWCSLYAGHQAQLKATTTPATLQADPAVTQAYKAIMQEQLFNRMLAYLNPKTFPKLVNDPQGTVHTNYATTHLRQAIQRLASVSKIVEAKDGAPHIDFTGDNRDLGIIVNIQNNTNADFSVSQTSLDGSHSVQIGQLTHGLNELNLHTAALQTPANQSTATTPQSSTFSFEITESEAENPINISIKMMSGVEFLTFLKTLPRDKKAIQKDTFEMNGLPTSPEYLANPEDWYMVLIQNPTPASSAQRDPNQRIQAINISKLTGPYLLKMKINQQDIEIKATSTSETNTMQTVFQPSLSEVQIMKNPTIPELILPLLILPQFLWKLPTAQTLWMLMTTANLTLHTDFKLFGEKSFGDAFAYFKSLSCFDNQNRHDFFIDRYNICHPGSVLYNAPWLMANALYETELSHCSNMPQVYTAQDSYGRIVVNKQNFYYINFLVMLTPPKFTSNALLMLFQKQGFNAAYAYPLNQLYSFIINATKTDIEEGIFGTLIEKKDGVYQLIFTNKKNAIITSQILYLSTPIVEIEVSFINQTPNWIKSSVPTDLIHLTPGATTHFKVTYEFNPVNDKHILLAQKTSPIDKQEVFLPLQFSTYPITELYIDLFNTFNVKPYTRCYIIKDGNLPEPLVSLTQQDWQSGIYMVPIIRNNTKLNNKNPGALTAIFYKSDKSYLGEMTIPGEYKNHSQSSTGIREPVRAYSIYFSELNSLIDLYLSTGVLLQYSETT